MRRNRRHVVPTAFFTRIDERVQPVPRFGVCRLSDSAPRTLRLRLQITSLSCRAAMARSQRCQRGGRCGAI